MKIDRVKLSGYKSIKNIDLELKDINVLIGANGSGKSNFISFFQMLAYYLNNINGFSEFVNQQGGANALLHYGSRNTKDICAEVTFETNSGTNIYSVELGQSLNDQLYFKAESLCFSGRGRDKHNAPIIHLGSGNNSSRLASIEDGDQDYARYIATIKAFRNMMKKWQVYQFHDTSPNSYIRTMHHADDNSYLRNNGGNLSAYLYMLKNDYPKHFARIQQSLCSIAPYIEELLPEEGYNSSKSVQLRWKEQGADYSFGTGQMSDGSLRALALITLLEQPQLPEVICIDEPELGLHPEAISMLGALMIKASEKSQIIVSTQSPTLLDCFMPEDIIICDRNIGKTELKRLDMEQYQTWLNEYTLSQVWNTNIIGGRP